MATPGTLCRSCTMLDRCPVRAPNHRTKGCQARNTVGDFRLEITPEIRLRDHMYALQQTTAWKDRHKIRAGIEATNSELKRAHGIGRLRARRVAKVCFAVACKVIACNIKRWAKAHLSLKRPLQGCLSSFRVWVTLWSELVRVPLFKKRIISMVGSPSK
jgi:Transposase DDE domain